MRMKRRKQIAIRERVSLELNKRERDLIIKHTFAGNNLTDRLRLLPRPGKRPVYRFTLDDLDELMGLRGCGSQPCEGQETGEGAPPAVLADRRRPGLLYV